MSFFRRSWSNEQDGNGLFGEELADNKEENFLEQGERIQRSKPVKLDRKWTMGQGVVEDTKDFGRLMSMRPEGVMSLLEVAAVEVGTIQSTDTIVNAAFGHRQILTRESNDETETRGLASWKEFIEMKAQQNDPKELGGWNKPVTLTAYRLSIKDAAAVLGDGVLTPLLRREQKGVPTDKIWEFLSVQAIVQHKWDVWAARCLFLESICFFGWLISFVCFLLVYIADDITEDYDTMDPDERGAVFIAYIADTSSVIFMSPFLVKAFNAVVYYGWERLQMWSVIDSCCYVLQLLISVFHYFHFRLHGGVYTTLLAVHCVLLFVKVQYYCRVLEVGAAYVESLKTLIAAVRGLLLFVVLTAISAALAFSTLYKWDFNESNDEPGTNKPNDESGTSKQDHESNKDLEGFRSFPKAIITTFSVLLGNFEPSYVFGTDNRYVKGIFFIVFEAIISIAVLNLMIAVMTQSYAWILSRGLALHNRCRAETIDRLEVTLPRCFHHKYEQYIHFIIREDNEQLGSLFTHKGLYANIVSTRELHRQIVELKESMKELNKNVSYAVNRTNDLAGSSSSSPSSVLNQVRTEISH